MHGAPFVHNAFRLATQCRGIGALLWSYQVRMGPVAASDVLTALSFLLARGVLVERATVEP